MCAIVDANVRDEVFGNAASPAGKFFLDWLTSGKGKLVVGGRLRQELADNHSFTQWFQQAALAGRVINVKDVEVESATLEIESQEICRSNDPHIIALAKTRGTQLLFTNDELLQLDFKKMVHDGIIYTTRRKKNITSTHKSLLGRRQPLCNC